MTYDEFKSFIPQFEAIRSFAGRIEAARQYLGKPIGSGSGRMVFSIDDDKVLKLAKNAKGIAQNETEANTGYYHDTQHIVTKVIDSPDDNTWLISEKGKKVNEKRIIQLTGIPSLYDLHSYLRNFVSSNNGRGNTFGQSKETIEALNDNEFAQDLQNFVADYSQSAGDMGRASSYGEVLRDGQPSIVLTDYGLNDEVYNTYYDNSRKQRYRSQMYELYNNMDGNDDILSDIGGGQEIRNGMVALTPDSVGINEDILNEVTYDRETADKIANEVARIKGLSRPQYLGAGYFGVAYDIGNNQVLKITSDNSEAFENMELLGKSLQYIAQPYNVYRVKSSSEKLPPTYAIVLEKLKTDKSFDARMKRLKYAFEKILNIGVGAAILTYVNGNNGYVDTNKIEKYLAKNPQDMEFFNALLNIAKELKKYGIESVEYTNADNLGYTKNGDIGLFDVGFTDGFLNPRPEVVNLNEFGGDSLYVTPNNMGGGDDLPVYNNNDTSPSIQNDLNANSAMYAEDLNYEYASDATQDEYVISERIMSSMAGSSTVDIKKKCKLGGNGNTSTACNQGDISNLNIKPLTEMNGSHPKDYWAWVSPDNRLIKVPTLKHKDYIMRIYKDAEFGWDYDRVFDKALEDGWVRAVYEYNANNYSIELSLNGDTEERVKDVFRKIFADAVKYGRNYVYLEWEHPTRNHVKITTGDEEGRKQLSGLMTEEYLGILDYENEDFNDPIEVFKNPKTVKNLKPDIRGVIDSTTGDFYVANARNFMHATLNQWLNDKFGLNFATDFYDIYQNPFKIVPVQRDENTNVFKLGELFSDTYDTEEMEKIMPQIQKVFEMAKVKNPTVEFSTELIDTPIYPLREDIDASEAYSDEDGLQTIVDGKRNICGFVTYGRKDIIQRLEDTGLNILPLTENPYGLVIVFNDRGRENALKLWKYATSKGGYFQDETPEEARFIGKMLQYSDDSIERFVNKIYDENGQRRKKMSEEVDGLENSSTFAAEIPVNTSTEMMTENELMSLNDLPFKADVETVGGKIYSVGGAVRDGFLGKESKDLDILITGVPFEDLETILAKYGRVDSVGKSFGVLKFMPNGMKLDEPIDIAIPRTETPTTGGGHKDFNVTSDHALPIEKDLERRDFTINAIGKDSEGNVVDPFNGQEDLKNKIIRAVNPQAFSDDPLRMLRAVQFASRFGFTIEPTTMKMIQDTADRIKDITPERILTEFDKIVKKGDKRIAAQLLKDTGLFKHIFGFDIQQSTIDRSPFEDTHTMGEFLYLLTRLLPDPAVFYKTNLKGDIDTYKEIKALNMGLTNENENPIALRSVAYNMYGTSPQSLQSQILPTALRTAADELLSGKFPKTLGELAVNGNDLLEKGLQGSQIGQALKKMLLKVYSGRVANDKDALLTLLDNNDLDEAYGRRGEFDDFERQYASQKQEAIGEVVGYVYGFVGYKQKYIPIYLNPKTLQNFEGNVKAIGNIKGNIYVTLQEAGFVHGEIGLGAGLFSSVRDVYNNYDTYVTLNRIGKTNSFEIGESTFENAEENDSMYNVDAILAALKQKNPQYDYFNTNRDIEKMKIDIEKMNSGEIGEGVGDKYAEKKFGIPDAGREFEDKYQRHRLVIDGEEPFGYVTGFIDWRGNTSSESVPIYKNPKSLIKFDYDVRAISDNQGNLYVALVNEGFNHGEMAAHIGLVGDDDTIYDRIGEYLLLHRVKDKDVFGFADSSEEEYNQSNEDRKRVTDLLNLVKRRNPQFKFIPKYYEEITGDKNIDESLNETIKGGTYVMYHGSNHAFTKFTDEFVGKEEANDQEGAGIYFTTSEEEAGRYGRYIYKVQLKPRKLTNIANKRTVSVTDITRLIKMSPTWKEDVLNWDESVMRGLAKAIKSLFDYSDNEKDLFQQIEHDFFRYESRLYVQGMTKLGYDGQLINKDYEGITHIIVYNPEIITILESNVEEKPQINEEMGRVLYSAVVLDNKSKHDLIKVFKPMIPDGYEILAHHMTLNMGGIDPKYKRDLGRDVELTVTDYAMDDKVMAVGVEGYPTNNKKAHITVAVNRTAGGKPKMSNNLTDWKPLGFPLKLIGTVSEVKNTNNGSMISESVNKKSKYLKAKDSLVRSKSIDKEMKELIAKYMLGGSTYHEGGRVHGLSKPNVLREKSPKADGVSMGADKNGFYVYTHRARSKSHPTPEQITIKEIEFIESTG
jgi:tRNA nucleotidyltransferase/poly(A) polymerase